MYCLGQFCLLFTVNNIVYKFKKYDVAHVVMDMYIPTKFHGFICFGFWVMLVEQEEEEDEEGDEQNSLS